MRVWEKRDKDQYRNWLKSNRYYDPNWIVNQLKREIRIIYDETVNSIRPLRIHRKRSGKFKQVVFQVVYDLDRKYGFVYKLNKHFKFLNPKDIEQFKTLIGNIDSTFRGYWIKDKRVFGSTDKAKGFITVNKYRSSPIERLFGFKNGLYIKTKYGKTIQSDKELIELYSGYFRRLKIYPINF